MATLTDVYNNEIAPKLKEELGLDNVMEVPRITKITLNMGVGEALGDKKVLEAAVGDMQKIAGQKPIVTKARKSIAGGRLVLVFAFAFRASESHARAPAHKSTQCE